MAREGALHWLSRFSQAQVTLTNAGQSPSVLRADLVAQDLALPSRLSAASWQQPKATRAGSASSSC
jgi:hypothetical protein